MYVLFKGENLYTSWVNGGPDGCFYNVSENGWMDSIRFLDWFQNVFIEKTKDQEGPKLLILDGHKSHITLELSEAAVKNNISVICLITTQHTFYNR